MIQKVNDYRVRCHIDYDHLPGKMLWIRGSGSIEDDSRYATYSATPVSKGTRINLELEELAVSTGWYYPADAALLHSDGVLGFKDREMCSIGFGVPMPQDKDDFIYRLTRILKFAGKWHFDVTEVVYDQTIRISI